MKYVIALALILLQTMSMAQVPMAIPYQAVARDSAGNLLQAQTISLRMTIRNATAGGTMLYRETHSAITSDLGLFTVNIGQGTPLGSSFSGVSWSTSTPRFLQVEMDAAGGSNYINMGAQQLLSVPYAMHAGTTTGGWNITGNSGTTASNFLGTTDNIALNFRVNNQKAGRLDPASPFNSFFGYLSGNVNTTGRDNTAFGYLAFTLNTTGNECTALGSGALQNNVASWGNVAIGYLSQQYANNSAAQNFPNNTAIGYRAMRGSPTTQNITGTINTAVGANTLYNLTSGSNNTAVGYQALMSNTEGGVNTAVGYNSLRSNVTGDNNVAIGSSALFSNVAGNYGVAIGERSQYYAHDTTGYHINYNTSVGYNSLRGSTIAANNSGTYNSAFGAEVLMNNSTGQYNTGCGHQALQSNSTASFNTAIGYQSLYNSNAGNNTAIGWGVMTGNSTGEYNTGLGSAAMYYLDSGEENVGIGSITLNQTTASDGNTALGHTAGCCVNNGGLNTFLGHDTRASVAGLTNSTAIGDNTQVTASNQVRIGNGVTSIGGPQNWSNTSDARIKEDVRDDVKGISFIKLLRPVTYYKNFKIENSLIGNENDKILSEDNNYEKTRYSGFIAQEVEQAAAASNYDFSGIDKPKNENDLYGLRYAEFVVPLIKAVQEQQMQIEKQNAEIIQLKQELAGIRAELSDSKNLIHTQK